MPLKFWDEAFSTTAYLINRLPSHIINFDTLSIGYMTLHLIIPS
jgi:hypothetical protein